MARHLFGESPCSFEGRTAEIRDVVTPSLRLMQSMKLSTVAREEGACTFDSGVARRRLFNRARWLRLSKSERWFDSVQPKDDNASALWGWKPNRSQRAFKLRAFPTAPKTLFGLPNADDVQGCISEREADTLPETGDSRTLLDPDERGVSATRATSVI